MPPWVSGLTPRGLNLGGLNRALPPSDPFVCFADAVLRLIFGLIGARAGGAMVRATLKKKWWVRSGQENGLAPWPWPAPGPAPWGWALPGGGALFTSDL